MMMMVMMIIMMMMMMMMMDWYCSQYHKYQHQNKYYQKIIFLSDKISHMISILVLMSILINCPAIIGWKLDHPVQREAGLAILLEGTETETEVRREER